MKLILHLITVTALILGNLAYAGSAADEYCRDRMAGEEKAYEVGFGQITLSGQPLKVTETWTAVASTLSVEFNSYIIEFNAANTPLGTLGDWIDTVQIHVNQGHTPFALKGKGQYEGGIALVHPYGDNPSCFGFWARQLN